MTAVPAVFVDPVTRSVLALTSRNKLPFPPEKLQFPPSTDNTLVSTHTTSPSACALSASALALANGRNGINTASAASEWSVCLFFLRAVTTNSSSASCACFAASGNRAGIETRLPVLPFEGSEAECAAEGEAAAGAVAGTARVVKKRDTTLVCGKA
jgi:hypothetical protein